jgi:hypothetical protein
LRHSSCTALSRSSASWLVAECLTAHRRRRPPLPRTDIGVGVGRVDSSRAQQAHWLHASAARTRSLLEAREGRHRSDGDGRKALGVAASASFLVLRAVGVGAHAFEAVIAAVLLFLRDRARAVGMRAVAQWRELFRPLIRRNGFRRRLLSLVDELVSPR